MRTCHRRGHGKRWNRISHILCGCVHRVLLRSNRRSIFRANCQACSKVASAKPDVLGGNDDRSIRARSDGYSTNRMALLPTRLMTVMLFALRATGVDTIVYFPVPTVSELEPTALTFAIAGTTWILAGTGKQPDARGFRSDRICAPMPISRWVLRSLSGKEATACRGGTRARSVPQTLDRKALRSRCR